TMTPETTEATTVTPVEGRVHIFFDGGEIASTVKALRVDRPGRATMVFVPLDAVHPGILEASETRREDPDCGEAHFYTIKTLTADGPDAAWYFPYAEGIYEPIRDLLTFAGEGVEVRYSDV